MWSFPTLEPVVLENGTFAIERMLPQAGEVLVSAGEQVRPDHVIARSSDVEQTLTLYVASELGVENGELSKYVSKSVGSTVKKGDVIARVRRGLRTASVASPASGTLVSVDDESGTVIVSTSLGKRDLLSLVSGEVEQVAPDVGAIIRTSGTRVYGIAGFGAEAIGRLVCGVDRPDRELTADSVSEGWRDCVVLAGLTAAVPALIRLREVGAAAVICGSIPEGDVRRFLAGGQMSQPGFWNPVGAVHGELSLAVIDSPLVIVATEGFGRRPMLRRLFDVLAERDGETVSVSGRTVVGANLARPAIFLEGAQGMAPAVDDQMTAGRGVRLVDSGAFSEPAVVLRGPYKQVGRYGTSQIVVDVQLDSGRIRSAPLSNLEVID